MLKINHLNISYQNTPAVQDLSLAVGAGQIVGIAGESGSGKSTMLRSIIGLLGNEGRITAGDILFEGRQLQRMKDRELEKIRGKDIAMIFQQPESSFDPVTTIGKQFCEAVRVHEKVSKKEALDRGRELLEKLHFQDPERILDSYAFELSGGMCQRAAIALGMVCKPRLLLADEPTSALDVTVQSQTADVLMELRENFGTSILMVTHNMGVIAYMADYVGVMYKGRLVEWGKKEEILLEAAHPYTKALIRAIPKFGETYEKQIPYTEEITEGKPVAVSPTHWILGGGR